MYNESLKRRFIDYYTHKDSTRKVLIGMFSALEKYELEQGTDICQANSKVLKLALEDMMGIQDASVNIRVRMLKRYVDWCKETAVAGATGAIHQIKITGISKIRERMIHSPVGLQNYLNALYEPESELTIDNIYRCWCWLAFYGADEEESIRLPRSSVDLSRHEITLSTGTVPIDDDAFPAFRNCAALDAFRYKHARYEMMRQRADSEYLLSGIRAQKSIRSMTIDMSRRAKAAFDEGKTAKRLSYSRIKKSGLFYRMEQMEVAGYPVDFTEAADRFMDGKEYKLDKSFSSQIGLRNTIAKELAKEYENWKNAFRY